MTIPGFEAPATSAHDKAQQDMMRALATFGGIEVAEEDILFQGTKIILPTAFSNRLDEAASFIYQVHKSDEETMTWTERFRYRPNDGALAMSNAIRKAFGVARSKGIETFFGTRPPETKTVWTALGEKTSVPWGMMIIPTMPGLEFHTGAEIDAEYGPIFVVNVKGPRKYRFHVQGLFNLIQAELEEYSIYRGKAIDGKTDPTFLDLRNVSADRVVYSEDVMLELSTHVWSPMRHRLELEKAGLSGKRAVLFSGPYGTGKTLGAYLTAQIAVQNGWTFIMVRPGKDDLELAMQTARMYQPCVVFFEDLDTVGNVEGGSDHISRVLDMFDGLESKGLNLLFVLTTNHVNTLHKAMLRSGRLDAIIPIGALDRPGLEKLARVVIGDNLAPDVEFDAVFTACDGYPPAFVMEAFARCIRYSIATNDGELKVFTTADLVHAANGLRPQFELMEAAEDKPSDDTLGDVFSELITEAVEKHMVDKLDESRILDALSGDVTYILKTP